MKIAETFIAVGLKRNVRCRLFYYVLNCPLNTFCFEESFILETGFLLVQGWKIIINECFDIERKIIIDNLEKVLPW